jgi:hypothetical protein
LRSTATQWLIVVALGLAASLPGLPAAGADTADSTPPRISGVRVSPSDVVLPASRSARKTTSFTIRMRVSDRSGVDTVVAGLYSPKGGSGRAYRLTRTSGSAEHGVWQVVVRVANPQPTGQWRMQAFAVDNKQNSTDPGRTYGDYLLRERTHFAHFDASEPTPVGGQVRFRGFLQRFDAKLGWTGYPHRPVTVEFQPLGDKQFHPVQTIRTGADGSVADTTVVAKGPGTWRMSFAGNEQRAPSTSRADEVSLPPVTKPAQPAVPPGVRCDDTCPTATPTPTPTATPDRTRRTDRPATAAPTPTRSTEPTRDARPVATATGPASPAPRRPGARS